MGLLHPKPYKVFRNGEWVLIEPTPVEYNEPCKLRPVQITKEGLYKKFKKRKK